MKDHLFVVVIVLPLIWLHPFFLGIVFYLPDHWVVTISFYFFNISQLCFNDSFSADFVILHFSLHGAYRCIFF